MKKTILGILGFLFLVSFNTNSLSNECEVKEFYKAVEPDDKTMVLTKSGDIEEVELILVPAKMDEGLYKVKLTRKETNLYKVEGTNYYIETRYCYEYSTYNEVVLKVESNYGYTKGKIIF